MHTQGGPTIEITAHGSHLTTRNIEVSRAEATPVTTAAHGLSRCDDSRNRRLNNPRSPR